MKILEIIPQLEEGGAERIAVDLCNEFTKTTEVHLILFFNSSRQKFLYKRLDPTIKVHLLDKRLGFDIRLFSKIFKLIKKISPDIVHTHIGAIKYTFPCALVFKKINFFHTVHNDADKEQKPLLRKLLRFFYSKKKITPITISISSNKSFIETYPNVEAEMVFNGRKSIETTQKEFEVREEIERISKNTKTLVNVGRVSPQKNQMVLVDIVNELISEGYQLKLFILGGASPGKEDLFEDLMKKNDKNISILGSKENVSDYLKHVDGFILTSIYEGLPISLLEALDAGCVPVCTPVGGIKQVITHKQTGFLSNNTSSKSIKQVIIEWYNTSDQELEAIRLNCNNLFNEEYSIETCAHKYLEVFKTYK